MKKFKLDINSYLRKNYFYLLRKLLIVILFLFYYLLEKDTNVIKGDPNNKNTANIKICICTLGKNENKYVREYIHHYEKYGVDKIFLYDNNEKNGENFKDIIIDYINKGFVTILNWRGKKLCQHKIMNDCYRRNSNQYNWLIYYDLDEYIYLKNYTNLKDYLNEPRFNKCQIILYINY